MDVIIVSHTEFGVVKNRKVVAFKWFDSNSIYNLDKVTKKYGAKVTYAVCPEVADYFPKSIDAEIGLHIHPGWQTSRKEGINYYVGDKYLREHCKQSSNSSVLRDYSYEEQLDMIRVGKDYIVQKFAYVPTIFVAGRWSLNNDTFNVLCKLGFTHDCSAQAHLKAFHHDWSKLPRICMPYHPYIGNYQLDGNMSILELPSSQMIRGGSVNPEQAPRYGMIGLELTFLEYYYRKMPLFHICLHSACMQDAYFVTVMDKLLKFIVKHKDIKFKYASEVKEYD